MAAPTQTSSRTPQHKPKQDPGPRSSRIDRAPVPCPPGSPDKEKEQQESPDKRYIRLHITPLDADLAKVVLSSPALSAAARNLSFHAVETFPDRRYGFVDLPADDAEKLRRRLNGAVLRGVRIRIEPAREESTPAPLGSAVAWAAAMGSSRTDKGNSAAAVAEEHGGGDHGADAGAAVTTRLNRSKKRKHDEVEVLSGVLLEEGRKVKRGWTVSAKEESRNREEKKRTEAKEKMEKKRREKEKKDKKKNNVITDDDEDDGGNDGGEDGARESKKDRKEKRQEKKRQRSKYTDDQECLVKTVLPPSAVAVGVSTASKPGRSAEDAPAGEDEQPRKKKRKSAKSKETVVIHEFENTTKFPTFLKAISTPAAPPGKARADATAAAAEYVDGKGWVDADWNVVEAVKSTRPVDATKRAASKRDAPGTTKTEDVKARKRETSKASSGAGSGFSSSSPHESSDESGHASGTTQTGENLLTKKGSEPGSSSGSDSEAESQEDLSRPAALKKMATIPPPAVSSMPPPPKATTIISPSARQLPSPSPPSISVSRPRSSGSSRSLAIKIPRTTTTTTTTSANSATSGSRSGSGHPTPATQQREVHPLEALYKRPKPAAEGLLTVAAAGSGSGSSSTTTTLVNISGPSSSVQQTFSFFGSEAPDDGHDDNDDSDADHDDGDGYQNIAARRKAKKGTGPLAVPMTPFTRQDFETRGLRSAAPTPDTAHPGRKSPWGDGKEEGEGEEDEEEDEDEDDGEEKGKGSMVDGLEKRGEDGAGGSNHDDEDDEGADDDDGNNDGDGDDGDHKKEGVETGFQAWFWEHRGDLNRAWKKRRKLVGKEKRYRDNKARGSRLT